MKSRITALVCFLIAPMIFSACASSGGAARQGQIRANLGTSSRSVLISETVDALTSRYGYLMLRSVVDTEDIRFETDWRQETALADERDQGYTHARSKITIMARPRNRSGSGAQNLAVTFIAETQVLPFGNDVWIQVEPTEMREDNIREISNFLRRSYQTALR